MRTYFKVVAGIALSCLISNSYAIQVNVKTSSDNIRALGFSVNKKSYGGLGRSYSKSGLPAGVYSFGVRSSGRDIACTSKGRESVRLTKDTTVNLNFNGQTCTLQMS